MVLSDTQRDSIEGYDDTKNYCHRSQEGERVLGFVIFCKGLCVPSHALTKQIRRWARGRLGLGDGRGCGPE
ncbi:hypothetical protein Hanom_Chr16g01435801 [Helianthus anomalus]